MIAQIVQKLFGPLTAGSGVATTSENTVIAMQGAEFAQIAAEVEAAAPALNGASAETQGAKALLQDSQTLEVDDALLAGVLALGGDLRMPVAAVAQNQIALVMPQQERLMAQEMTSQPLPDMLQNTDNIEKLLPILDGGIAELNAPLPESNFALSGTAFKDDPMPYSAAQMGPVYSVVTQLAQVTAYLPHLQDSLAAAGFPNSSRGGDLGADPRGPAPVSGIDSADIANPDLNTTVVIGSPQSTRIDQNSVISSNGAIMANAALRRSPSPAQISLQAAAVDIESGQISKPGDAEKAVLNSDGNSAPDEADARTSAAMAGVVAFARVENGQLPPFTPSQNVINFTNLQLDHSAALGSDAALELARTDAISMMTAIGDSRSGGASGFGAGVSTANAPGFSAANMPSADLSAQILPRTREAQNGGIDLTLSPAELGQLRFEMRQVGDQMQILLSAERPETLDLLRRHIDALRNDFAEAGFSGASLSFGSSGQGREQNPPPQFSPEYQEITAQTAPVPNVMSAPSPIWAQKQDAVRGLNLRL